MMAAILNLTFLDSAILHKINFTHSFSLNWMLAAIMNLAIFYSAIFDFPLKLTHTFQDWFLLFAKKKLHSFILTQLDGGSHLEFCHVAFRCLFSSLRFTQKHSHSTLTLTQTNSIWLKLILSHLTWWWQPSWILPSWIWPSWIQPS